MPLTIYRRHSEKCIEANHITPDIQRAYTECNCSIWIEGTTETGVYPRQSLKGLIGDPRDWKLATAYIRTLDAESKDARVYGPTLADCITKYMDYRKSELKAKTEDATRRALTRLQNFVAERNVSFIRELTLDLIENFQTYGLATLKKSTSVATARAKLICFLDEAFRRDWITVDLATKLRAKKVAVVYEQKSPFTESELSCILTTAETINSSSGGEGYASNGKTFRLLLELMLSTGLRVGDAVRFNPSACVRSEHLWKYEFFQQKQKTTDTPRLRETYLTDELMGAIKACEWLSSSRPFAYLAVAGKGDQTSYLAIEVWRQMKRIGAKCGIDDCRPHRLRDSFCVRKLVKGVPVGDVSIMMGHSSVKVTEKYYAKWIPARSQRLERVFYESL